MPNAAVASSTSSPSSPVAPSPSPPENECLGPAAPVAIRNDASALPATRIPSRNELNARRNLILDQLRESSDPSAPQLAAMLKQKLRSAPDAATREVIIARFEYELSKPEQLLPALKDMCCNIANVATRQYMWRLSSQALPGITGAASAARVARALYEGDWRAISAALPSLLPFLPALRSVDSIEALIRSLPTSVVKTLQSMHEWVKRADDATTLELGIEEAGGALAAAVLLWQLHNRLPQASGQLQGLSNFVVNLPYHWQQLVSMNGLGGTLFAPAPEGPGRMRGLDRKEMVAFKHAEDRKHLTGNNDTVPLPHRLASAPSSAPQVHVLDMQKAAAPHHLAAAGAIAASPLDELYAAASPASRPEGGGVGWVGWLSTAFGLLSARGGFSQVATSAPEIELQLMEAGQFVTPAADPASSSLLGNAPQTVAPSLVAAMGNYIKQNPVKATVVATGSIAAATVAWMKDTIWPPGTSAPTLQQLAEMLTQEVVAVNGAWGSGVDQLLGTPDVPGKRRRRHALEQANTTYTTEAPPEQNRVLGLTDAQRDQMLGDGQLTDTLRSMQAWALALAQDIARQDGWKWVASLVGSEQELVVTQLRLLHDLEPVLTSLEALPQQVLDDALKYHGYKSGSAGLQVDLGTTTVAGVKVQEKTPLLEYCLTRAGSSTSPVRITRDGKPLNHRQQELLQGFLASKDCQQLQQQVDTRSQVQQPALVKALRARLVIDAVRAKAGGALGSGPDALRRGADIVLGYLQGAQDVESSLLTYSDVTADGSTVKFTVPHYLVLRSASEDARLNGQVVLYRADLQQFDVFKDENAFRQFLDERRAKAGLHVVNGEIDKTLVEDIIAAAPSALRPQVQEQVDRWQERQSAYQNGKQGTATWNAGDSFVLDFKPVSGPGQSLDDWAAQRIQFAQQQAQQQLASNRLRWSTLGIANAATDADHADHLSNDVQTLQDHAKPALTTQLVNALKLVGIDFKDLNPDRILLTVQGTRMSLTDWAVSGWQQHGLMRPPLPVNLPDLPGFEGGLPNQHQELEPWPSQIDLFDMDLTVQKADASGAHVDDPQRTDQLLEEDARRAIIRVLADMAWSNELADAYVAHLKDVAGDSSNGLHASMANHIRVHMAWMIESAYQEGRLDAATYTALMRSHARIDGSKKEASSLQVVKIRGHEIQGIWSLSANGKPYVFVPGTSAGDQLLDEAAFKRWLLLPEAQDYVMARAPLRVHQDLNNAFNAKQSAKGIAVTFGRTGGPWQAGKAFIDMRISDVDEMTASQLERVTQALTIFSSIVAGITCTLGSGGTMTALCISSTLALVAEGIHSGVRALERGDINGAIESIGGSLGDALDVLGILALPTALFQLGRKSLPTVKDAMDALAQWRRQKAAFAQDGSINPAFTVSSDSLSTVGLPTLKQQVGGATLYAQGRNQYVKQGDRFIHVYQDENGNVLRLKLTDDIDEAGPPVHQKDGQWQLLDQQPSALLATTPRTAGKPDWIKKVPEAGNLPSDKLDELEALFGVHAPGMKPSPDMKEVIRDLNMHERIKAILKDPQSLGEPGDEAIMMRAWADSPLLGNGKSVETFIQEAGEWTRGARFGKGPVGLMVEVPDARHLPTLEMLIDAADEVALRQRLKLSPDSDHQMLVNAIRQELARTIVLNQEQSLLSWKRWLSGQHRLPTAADNLNKHYPELTKSEAESLVAGDVVLEKFALSWVFPAETSNKVADMLAQRSRRTQRQSLLEGRIRSVSQAQELRNHLQETVPKRNWIITDNPSGEGFALSFSDADGKENLRTITFTADGDVRRPMEDGGEMILTWEQAIFDELSPSEQKALGNWASLRNAVVEHMKRTPLVTATCNISKGVKKVVKRSADCDPSIAVDLDPVEVDSREEVTLSLQNSHDIAEHEYAKIRALREELEQLKLTSKRPEGLTPEQAKRHADLSAMTLMHEKNFRMKNFVAYRVGDLMVGSKKVVPTTAFPETGSAYSGPTVSWLSADQYVGDVPMRRVFLRDDEVDKQYKGKGKQRVATAIPPNDRFRSDYPMGADLTSVSSERTRGSGMVELTDDDLGANLPLDGSPGSTHWVTFQSMDDAQILALEKSQLSPTMRSLLGDTSPLASNLRSLSPGSYRVFEIRSCSEGKFLQLLSDGLIATEPGTASRLQAPVNTPVPEVTGEVTLVSDMHPCATTCNRRLTALMQVLPNLKLRVYYHYTDNTERAQHRLQIMVDRLVKRTEPEWSRNGTELEDARKQAHALLTNKADPGPRELAEKDLMENPPTAEEMPIPRLWTPEEEVSEGF